MSSFWRNFHHWLHWKLSFWQLPVQPVMIISSKWRHFRFSECHLSYCVALRCWYCISSGGPIKLMKSMLYVNPCIILVQLLIYIYNLTTIASAAFGQMSYRIHGSVNTLRPRQMDAIWQTTFSSAFSWMKMFEFLSKFHWRLFLRVKLTIFQHWCR